MCAARKDNTTTLEIVSDPDDEVKFAKIYERPMYMIHNLAGKPESLMRLTYSGDNDEQFNVTYPDSTGTGGVEDLAPHKHFHHDIFADDDFFQVNNETTEFQAQLKNFSFALFYTG